MTETIVKPSQEPSKKKGAMRGKNIRTILQEHPEIERRRKEGVVRANKAYLRRYSGGKTSKRMKNKARELFFKDFNRIQPKKNLEDNPLLMSFWNSCALNYSILQGAIFAQESDRQLSIFNRRYIDSLSKFYNALSRAGKLSSAQFLAFQTSNAEPINLNKEESKQLLDGYFAKGDGDKIVNDTIN